MKKKGLVYLDEVSMIVIETRSGNISSGRREGGKTGETLVGKFSETAVRIKLDLPVPWSPATTIRISFLLPLEDFAMNTI